MLKRTRASSNGAPAGGAWRRWALYLVATTLVPLVVLVTVEVVLRAAGYGYDTGFFVAAVPGETETTNSRYGWRFFPRTVARTPVLGLLPVVKDSETYRIFVLGGSAAMGTPEPSFGFGRILEVVLRESYPGVDFEVFNAAMAAINSHVVVDIARRCARRQPDLFLVYLGNNEVVGPYGPGTVFSGFSRSLEAIRLGLEVRRLRIGQLLQKGLLRMSRERAPARWRGMEMFLEQQVGADDRRLEALYEHLERNLLDLVRIGHRAGAPVVLSTAASNLKDNPPFASQHRSDLPAFELRRWTGLRDSGIELAVSGPLSDAIGSFRGALELDGRHAEVHFRLARLLLQRGDFDAARRHFVQARDLDTLRFRADSRINEIIRRVAGAANEGVSLVDAESRLAEAPEVEHGIPGDELFYEHVHLKFAGNYRLALAFFEQIGRVLPEAFRARRGSGNAIPSMARCAEILALTQRDRHLMASTIYAMTKRPPFTGQIDHQERVAIRRQKLRALRHCSWREGDAALGAYRRALKGAPRDVHLLERYATALGEHGEHQTAVEIWRRLTREMPDVATWHTRLGFALADLASETDAVGELRIALDLFPDSVDSYVNLGSMLATFGRLEQAAKLFRRALDLNPGDESALTNLGHVFDRLGRTSEAVEQYRTAIRLNPESAENHRLLGELYDRRGGLVEATSAYRQALSLDPEKAVVHNNLGYALARQDQVEEAIQEYRRALDDDPEYALAYFNLGDALLALGRAAEAVSAYEPGLLIDPDSHQAAVNLEIALGLLEEKRSILEDAASK